MSSSPASVGLARAHPLTNPGYGAFPPDLVQLRSTLPVGALVLCLCVCQCICNIRRFTDCETGPISTNPGSMEAGEYRQTHWTCFVARRLEVVAVAGLLWISWCVLGGADFFVFFSRFCFSSSTHGLLQVRSPFSHLPRY